MKGEGGGQANTAVISDIVTHFLVKGGTCQILLRRRTPSTPPAPRGNHAKRHHERHAASQLRRQRPQSARALCTFMCMQCACANTHTAQYVSRHINQASGRPKMKSYLLSEPLSHVKRKGSMDAIAGPSSMLHFGSWRPSSWIKRHGTRVVSLPIYLLTFWSAGRPGRSTMSVRHF